MSGAFDGGRAIRRVEECETGIRAVEIFWSGGGVRRTDEGFRASGGAGAWQEAQ
jgi:hypothetical protein